MWFHFPAEQKTRAPHLNSCRDILCQPLCVMEILQVKWVWVWAVTGLKYSSVYFFLPKGKAPWHHLEKLWGDTELWKGFPASSLLHCVMWWWPGCSQLQDMKAGFPWGHIEQEWLPKPKGEHSKQLPGDVGIWLSSDSLSYTPSLLIPAEQQHHSHHHREPSAPGSTGAVPSWHLNLHTALFWSPPGDAGSRGGSSSFSLVSLGFSATKILDFFFLIYFLTDSCPTGDPVTPLRNTGSSWLISIIFTCINTEQMVAVDICK